MDDDTRYSIGEVAQRTGMTVKTIRFYSDRGIVMSTDRSPAGYRRYNSDAVARLALVHTLRELGVGLHPIRQVIDRELALGDVAAEHAAALDVQIRILRMRRAVLTAVVERTPTPEEMEHMHRLARLTASERERLIDDFLDATFTGLDGRADYDGPRRSMTPDLSDNPTEGQLQAWVELAELSLDPTFRASMRSGAVSYAADRSDCSSGPPRPDVIAIARNHAGTAIASGVTAQSAEADRVVTALTADAPAP